ncbi:MAG: cysteine dioxygenase family protein [Candidatus Sericytochromatia bacterium]
MHTFESFAHNLEQIIDRSRNYKEVVTAGASELKKLLYNKNLLTEQYIDDVLYGRIDNTVFFSEKHGFVVQVFTWDGHSETPVHDHGTWGLMGVYHNNLHVTEYAMTKIDENSYDVSPYQEFPAKENDVCYLLPPDEEIHLIKNPTDSLSISFHIYGKRILEYNTYDLENGQIIHNIV